MIWEMRCSHNFLTNLGDQRKRDPGGQTSHFMPSICEWCKTQTHLGTLTASSIVPRPNWPPPPAPQANTWPWSFTATEWERPQDTAAIFCASRAPTSSEKQAGAGRQCRETITKAPHMHTSRGLHSSNRLLPGQLPKQLYTLIMSK